MPVAISRSASTAMRCTCTGRPTRRHPQVHQCVRVLRLIVDHTIAPHNLRAQLGNLFSVRGGAVHADATQERDVRIPHTGLLQLAQQSRNQQVVRAGAGDVGKHDADAVARGSDLTQRRRPGGGGKRRSHGVRHVVQRPDRSRHDDVSTHRRGQRKLKERSAIRNLIHSIAHGVSIPFATRLTLSKGLGRHSAPADSHIVPPVFPKHKSVSFYGNIFH